MENPNYETAPNDGEALNPRSPMLAKLLIAWSLMAISVAVHAVGLTAAIRWARRSPAFADARVWPSIWLLICIAGWTILLSFVEIAVWGSFYAWQQCMPDLQSSLYFSAVTYTTTGYGDLVLPKDWRLVGGIEALTGILMCGWSTGFFFAVVGKMYRAGRESETDEKGKEELR
jgi:hypothetical protein